MLSVTALYAGPHALLYLFLASNVVRTRRNTGVSLGDGGDMLLQRRIRAHGNFAEYVPVALILMALAEFGGTSVLWIHALGIALVIGRSMHAFALSSLTIRPVARTGGTAATLTVVGTSAILCLVSAVRAIAA